MSCLVGRKVKHGFASFMSFFYWDEDTSSSEFYAFHVFTNVISASSYQLISLTQSNQPMHAFYRYFHHIRLKGKGKIRKKQQPPDSNPNNSFKKTETYLQVVLCLWVPTVWELHFALFQLRKLHSVDFDLMFLLLEMKILKYNWDEDQKRLKEIEFFVEKLHCRPSLFL